MKLAEQWVIEKVRNLIDLESYTKQVQADALRHCAFIIRNTTDCQPAIQFEAEADKLEA